MTFWLCLFFVIASFAAYNEKLGTVDSLAVIALLIIASVINDGFNKLDKTLKEKSK